MTTFGNNYVGEPLRWFDELHVHRAHRGEILLDYRVERAAALGDVPLQAANEAHVVRRVDENFDVHLFEQARLGKNQNPFDDHNRFWFDGSSRGQPRVRAKVVYGKLNRLARAQFLQMVGQQLVIDGVRMIEVRHVPIVQRHVLKIAIV